MRNLHYTLAALSILVLTNISAADSERVCNDLHKLACAPGNYDDGTGSAHRPNDEQEKTIAKKLSKNAYQRFHDELAKPDKGYLRKIALSATGLSVAPQCDGADEQPSADCLDRLSQGAADIVIKYVNGTPPSFKGESPASGKFKDVSFLMASDEFQDIKASLLKDARSSVASEVQEKKIALDIFPKIQKLLMDRLDEMVANSDLRKRLKEKVGAIKFSGQDCGDSSGQNAIAEVLTSNAFYSPLSNTFKYCAGFNNMSTSAFTISFIIAHELTHSIDPCGITIGPSDYAFQYKGNLTRGQAEKSFPIGQVISCLRNADSIGATSKGLSSSSTGSPSGSYPSNYATYNSNYGVYGNYGSTSLNPSDQPFTNFCDNDQITESFADWMAMEIVPDYIEKNYGNLSLTQKRLGYSNIYRTLCQADDRVYSGTHPTTELRANAIGLVHPKVRQQMGCKNPPTQYKYCPPTGREKAATPKSTYGYPYMPVPGPTPSPIPVPEDPRSSK
jgi:hypothetical protein